MPGPVVCDLCERAVDVHASYVVRIDVYADPSVPPLDTDTVFAPGGGDFDKTLDALLAEMKHLTADDLQDAVHRRFEYRLCPACQRRFLANPLGKPRSVRVAEN
jgi:hypothetical protein